MILLSGLNDPNGIAWYNGSLYVAEINKITRYDDADASVIANKVRPCQATFPIMTALESCSDSPRGNAAMHVMIGSKARD